MERNTAAKRFELQLIADDANDVLRLLLGLNEHPACGFISLFVLPLVSLVAEESYRYLSAVDRASGFALRGRLFSEFKEDVAKLRARVKLFDDTKGGEEALIELLALAHTKSSEWFNRPHQGLWARLKRRLQPDLGIYCFDGSLVGTTHTALPSVGFTIERLRTADMLSLKEGGGVGYDLSFATGQYLRALSELLTPLGFAINLRPPPLAASNLQIAHSDHYGRKVYAAVARSLPLKHERLAGVMTLVLSQVNAAHFVLPLLLPSASTLLFRLQFLTAYHATRALKSALVDEAARLEFGGGEDAQLLLGLRKVRNVVAHYELRDAAPFVRAGEHPLDSAVAGLAGRSRTEVAALVRRQLATISIRMGLRVSRNSLKGTRAFLGSHS